MQKSGSEDAKSVYHRHRRRQCRRENDLCAAASDGAGGHRRSAAFYGRLFQAGSRATVGRRKHGAALPGRQLPGGVRSAASAARRGRGCGKRRLPRPDRRRTADALGPRAVRNAGFAPVRRLPRGRADRAAAPAQYAVGLFLRRNRGRIPRPRAHTARRIR